MMKKYKILMFLLATFFLSCEDSNDFFYGKDKEMADAIANGDLEKIENLAKHDKINLNTIGKNGVSFLLWSFVKKEKESMKKLLLLGADPNLITNRPPINIKMLQKMYPDSTITVQSSVVGEVVYFMGDDYEWVDILANSKADFCNAKFSNSVLFSSLLFTNKIEVIFYLLDKGMDTDCRDNLGSTLVMRFAQIGCYNYIYKLLERGADLTLYSTDFNSKFDFENEKNILTPYKLDIAYIMQNWNLNIETQLPYRKKVKDYLRSKGYKFPKLEQWEINAGATESYEKRFN